MQWRRVRAVLDCIVMHDPIDLVRSDTWFDDTMRRVEDLPAEQIRLSHLLNLLLGMHRRRVPRLRPPLRIRLPVLVIVWPRDVLL